jgi:hypothetical protein
MMNKHNFTRRALLKTAPIGVVALATTIPNAEGAEGTNLASAAVPSDNPDAAIEAAFVNWSAAYDAMANNEHRALDDQLFDELRACERACVKLSPVTARGLAMQFLVFTAFGEFEATKSADHDFEATMLRTAGVSPPAGLAKSASVQDILNRLTTLPTDNTLGVAP